MASLRNLFSYIGRVFSNRQRVSLTCLLILIIGLVGGCSSSSNELSYNVSSSKLPAFSVLKENINGSYSSSVSIQVGEVVDKETLRELSKKIRSKYPRPEVLEVCYYQPGMDIATSSYWAKAYFDPDLSYLQIFGIKKEENISKMDLAKIELDKHTVNHEIIGNWIHSGSASRLIRISKDSEDQYYYTTAFLEDLSHSSRKARKEGEKYILLATTKEIKINGQVRTLTVKEKEDYYKVEPDGSLSLYTPMSGKYQTYSVL